MSSNRENLIETAIKCYQEYNYDQALVILNSLTKNDKKTVRARELKAIVLIERWDENYDIGTEFFEVIDHLNIAIKEDPENLKYYLYNLGNAYQKFSVINLAKNKNNLNPDIIKNFESAKKYFEKALSIDDNQPEVWINLGNSLNNLGRYLEGIECYDNAILKNPTHYNAWASRGTCYWHLSTFVSNNHDKNLLKTHAMYFLKMDFMFNPNIPRDPYIFKFVNEFFETNKIDLNPEIILKNLLPMKRSVEKNKFNLYDSKNQDFQQFHLEFCKSHGLFLNLHFDCTNCECKGRDLIEFSFITSIKDHIRPYELMKRLYAIKDDYKTARTILAYAQYRPDDLQFLDKQRYEPDYSLNYIFNVELLKNSFLSTMNIFDKIAFFLNEYESGDNNKKLPESKVNFWGDSIFNQRNLLENNNWNKHLVAIDSIRRELEGKYSINNEFKKMVDIRNYIAHRNFILHDIIKLDDVAYPYDPNNTPIQNPEYHMNIDEFFNLTIKAMRSIRNIIFSLSFYIQYKENEKIEGTNEYIPTMKWA